MPTTKIIMSQRERQLISQRSILLFLIALICFCQLIQAQKKLFQTWSDPSFHEILIDSDHISKITFRSHSDESVKLYTRSEGEIVANSIITVEETLDQLSIRTDFTPFYLPKNDKLAAHKVLAIELILIVPDHMNIVVRAAIADVYGSGTFNSFETELENGFLKLRSFRGDALLLSKWGAIEVRALSDVGGTAISKYNTVINNLGAKQPFMIKAESLHGTIKLLQTKKI
ncbi:MAG: hypothetical protein HKM28_04415 [Flavobacteriaceae bacterium]|nr:hypothetical protein [Flavobacteriaceae bacterium]